MSKKLRALLSMVLSVVMLSSVVGCGDKGGKDNSTSTPSESTPSESTSDETSEDEGGYDFVAEAGNYTYRTYTGVSPSNWNELTYQDSNDTQIMSYITSPLFEYNFKFDENGEIVPGDFAIEYSFATSLTDVSEDFGYEAGAGMAYEITIRDDGKWDDGTPIVAGDFVYTMKQQLDPLFKNYRADSYYNSAQVIKNAREYVFQGESLSNVAAVDVHGDNITDLTGLYFNANNVKAFVDIFGTEDMTLLEGYKSYFQVGEVNVWDELVGYAGDNRTPMTQEISAMLASLFGAEGLLGGYWGWVDTEIGYFSVVDATYPEMDFSEVGISAPNDTTIVLEFAKPLQLLEDDGTIGYKAAYNMQSLPLVKQDKYEASKKAPVEGSTLWTTNYNSSVETTASWGPYKLTEFQAGKYYKLEKNPNWYGWNMEKYEGQYQTTAIVCETIAEWQTAWMKFLKGEIMGIGIDVSVATDYKNSEQAYFTPDDYIGSLQLQASAEGLKNRESEGINKTILLQPEFRKALSLGIDRDLFAKTTTTASLAGFGLFNSMHYYDVANGKAYRESDAAKLVLCEVYGVNPEDYASLDDAVDAITGYDLQQARALVDAAYDKAVAAGDLKEGDKVVLTYGTSLDNEKTRRNFETLQTMWGEMMKGTKLEGKFELEFNASFGTEWSNDFRAGAYDICQGGWEGAAWDPGYFLLAYLDPGYMFSKAWDTSSHMMNFTINGVDATGAVTNSAEDSFTAEYDLLTWYDLLNGDWQSGVLNEEFRLTLIAALEQEVLTQYYSVPLTNWFDASLISYQVDYITYEYNTFMAYGGIQYMTYNYDDAEWAAYVAENAVGGQLNYK